MFFGRKKRVIERILIVEDEPLIAFDNEHFLKDQGYRVVATVDGVDAALAAIAGSDIDLILADVSLSDGGNGIEVAKAARARGMITLFVTGACPIEAQRYAAGCLAKPYAQRALGEAVAALDAISQGRAPRRLPEGLTLYAEPR